MFLRQSTASQEISLGQFLDSTDGDTEEGGLTIANTDIKLRKHGTTTLANKNSGGATVISNGVYQCTLDATDTNTAGQLEIYVHVSGALAVKNTYVVLTATAFDALLTGTYNNISPAEVNAEADTALTDYDGPTNAEMEARTLVAANYFDPTSDPVATVTTLTNLPAITSNWLTAAGIAASALDGKGDWNIGKTGYTVSTVSDKTGYSISGAITTLDGLNNFDPTSDAVANVTLTASCTTNTDMVTEPPTVAAIADGVWDEVQAGHTTAGTFGLYLDSEVSGAGGGSAPTVSEIADGVWDELLSAHTVSGSSGEALAAAGTAGDPWTTALPGAYGAGTAGKIIGDNINAPLDTIDANIDSILVDTGEIGTAGAGLTNINLPNQTMDITGNITGNLSGSVGSVTGGATSAAQTTAQNDLDIITGADGVNLLSGTQASIDAIEADTNELQGDWVDGGRLDLILDARSSQASVDTVDGNVDSILLDTAEIGTAGAGLTDLGGMSTGMKAEVNTEADTALTDYDGPTNAEMEARTPTAAQLAYITANAETGLPVTFTTSGGSTTAAVLNLVDGGAGSATDDQYNGRLLVFTDGTLKGVVTDITDYTGSTTTATITAIPFAPTSSHNARLI